MSWEVISGLSAFVLIWYLTYVLLKPRKASMMQQRVSQGIENITQDVAMTTATPSAV
jgi:hypothetical protein